MRPSEHLTSGSLHADGYVSHSMLFSPSGFLQSPAVKDVSEKSRTDVAPSSSKTFASVVASDISLPLPSPGIAKYGAYQAIRINSDVYSRRLALCQHSLIARIVLRKETLPGFFLI